MFSFLLLFQLVVRMCADDAKISLLITARMSNPSFGLPNHNIHESHAINCSHFIVIFRLVCIRLAVANLVLWLFTLCGFTEAVVVVVFNFFHQLITVPSILAYPLA